MGFRSGMVALGSGLEGGSGAWSWYAKASWVVEWVSKRRDLEALSKFRGLGSSAQIVGVSGLDRGCSCCRLKKVERGRVTLVEDLSCWRSRTDGPGAVEGLVTEAKYRQLVNAAYSGVGYLSRRVLLLVHSSDVVVMSGNAHGRRT